MGPLSALFKKNDLIRHLLRKCHLLLKEKAFGLNPYDIKRILPALGSMGPGGWSRLYIYIRNETKNSEGSDLWPSEFV